MSPQQFNWPPFKLVRLDADTGKPLDPDVGMRVYREFYDVKKDKNGKARVVAHKGNGSKKGEPAAADGKKTGGGGGKDNNGSGEQDKAKGNAADQPQDHKIDWTPEQDAKIKSMKADGKTWAEIAQEVGGTKGLVKNRFNQIKNDGGEEGGKAKDEKKEDNDKKDKHENKEKKKEEDKNNKTDHPKAPSKAPSKAASRTGEARFTMGEWRTLQEDALFSFGELQCLSELAMRDEQQQWLRIASAFCDKTGRRVHPDDIREKFAEMERMGSTR